MYLVAGERWLVKEALKSAEYHDSLNTVINEASRIADLIGNAKHYLAFTGAGILTLSIRHFYDFHDLFVQ